MKILVVDDNRENLEAAVQQLSDEHEVETASSFVEAARRLNGRHVSVGDYGKLEEFGPVEFDAVLLDLFMPGEPTGAYGSYGNVTFVKDVPYGFVLALRALQCGVKFVAIATDTNHHTGELPSALDLVVFPWPGNEEGHPMPFFQFGEGRLLVVEAPNTDRYDGRGPKDWARVLRWVTDGEIRENEEE